MSITGQSINPLLKLSKNGCGFNTKEDWKTRRIGDWREDTRMDQIIKEWLLSFHRTNMNENG